MVFLETSTNCSVESGLCCLHLSSGDHTSKYLGLFLIFRILIKQIIPINSKLYSGGLVTDFFVCQKGIFCVIFKDVINIICKNIFQETLQTQTGISR